MCIFLVLLRYFKFFEFFFSSENQVFRNVIKNAIEMLLKTIKRLRDDFSVNVIRY